MAEERVQRRLAAILAADVAGYSRLMEQDEAGTLAALKSRRKDVLEPLVIRHRGRVFKIAGDGVLVEFASAVNAVQCAVELQQGFAAANKDVPDERRIVLRIGVNLGDVMVEGGDLYGDGVNIAARLEALAEPGGILVSGGAYDQVRNKVAMAFDDLGPQSLKNIAEPVRGYRLAGAPEAARAAPKAITDKPSIAVRPFQNMSGDPEQEYFSDGITEDIITELSRFHGLFVVARNSSFEYRGKAVNMQRIGRELGVRYIVEGSVRRFGGRIRITAQLIDATTGAHLWADRYDRDLDDIFAIQDEVAKSVVAALPERVEAAMVDQVRRKPTQDLTAYDFLLRGESIVQLGGFSDRDALAMFKKALEIDPHCARAHVRIAYNYAYDVLRWGTPADAALRLALKHVRQALALDDGDASAHATAAWAYLFSGEYDLAESHAERAIDLNPNDWYAARVRGSVANYFGDHARGIEWLLKAMRLDPLHPTTKLEALMDAYYMSHDYEKSIAAFKQWHNAPAHVCLEAAAVYAQLGRMDEAGAVLRRYEEIRPEGYDVAKYVSVHIRLCKLQADRDHWLEGYRKAGLLV